MTRIQLQIYVDPGAAEVFCNLLLQDGTYERLAAIIDTGAEISLFPDDLLDKIASDSGITGMLEVEQAGIARQSFSALETFVRIALEDTSGQTTDSFEIPAWFTDTNKALIGFAGVLDRAALHIDMPQRIGWLDIYA